jgi:uncharacterized protein (DUF1499 family)
MSVVTTPMWRSGIGMARWAATIGFALALVALLMLAAGPVGWRAGWWHYRIGLQALMPYAGYIGLVAMGASAVALLLGAVRRDLARQAIVLAVLGLLAGGGAAYFPWHWNSLRGTYPRVNDVTTDPDRPPSLVFAEAMRKAEQGNPVAYGGAEIARVQKQAYPDIVPAMLDLAPAQAFERALVVAKGKGWTIVRTDAAAGIIEAGERSRWFGFTDDIAIRVGPAETGSRIDIRSSARQGRGDYGVNAARLRGFLTVLRDSAK